MQKAESFNSRKSINVSKSEEKDVSLEKKKSVNVYKSNKDFEQGTKDFIKIDQNDQIDDEHKIIQRIDSKESFNPYENIEDKESVSKINRSNNLSMDMRRQIDASESGQISSVDRSEYLPKLRTKHKSRMINYTYNDNIVMSTDNCKLLFDIRNKQKIVQKLNELNEKLSPRFKLSRIDLEDIENSSVIKAGDWNTKLSEDLLKSIKKQERRKLYYRNRVRLIAKRYKSRE